MVLAFVVVVLVVWVSRLFPRGSKGEPKLSATVALLNNNLIVIVIVIVIVMVTNMCRVVSPGLVSKPAASVGLLASLERRIGAPSVTRTAALGTHEQVSSQADTSLCWNRMKSSSSQLN